MNIALIDDRQEELDRLAALLHQKLDILGDNSHKIDFYHSGEEFLNAWTPRSYDLITLDVYMDGITGVDVARRIRRTDKDVRLVFCTSSNDFASESYEVGAHFYLHKPYSEARIDDMLSRLDIDGYELRRVVTLPDGKAILLRNVLYTEYDNHSVTVHTKHGDDLRCTCTHAELEAVLCQHTYFFSCYKGIIVNLHEVSGMTKDSFRISDGSTIPISRRKAKEAAETYAKFHFEKLRKEVFA